MAWTLWRITGLQLGSLLATYAISLLPAYLVEEKHMDYTLAAIVVNIFWGVVCILPLLIQFIEDSYLGNFRMAMLSTVFYGLGLIIITRLMHSNTTYWWLALPFLAIGVSGQQVISLKGLVKDEDLEPSTTGHILFACIHIIGVVLIPKLKLWWMKFIIAFGVMLGATFIFWYGSQYKIVEAGESPMTTVARVLIAAVAKRLHNSRSSQLHEGGDVHTRIAHSDRLRFLSKAAINSENHGKWNLCTETEVKEAKRALLALPLCLVFLSLGTISNVGDTYFLQQAKTMHNQIRSLDIVLPLYLLPLMHQLMKFTSPIAYFKVADWFCACRNITRHEGKVAYIGILASTGFALVCTLLAFGMETRRLEKIKDGSKLSVLELLPQCILLGACDGLCEKCLSLLFKDRSFPSTDRYLIHFALSCYGVGRMVSCLFSNSVVNTSMNMIVAWKASPFKYRINEAHVNAYLLVMTGICTANYFYCLFLCWAGVGYWSLET